MRKNLKFIIGLLAIFVTLPIGFYLQYKVLTLVQATELMWFLFWVNLPLSLFLHVVIKFAGDD